MVARRFERYLAGSVLVLFGILLVSYLIGLISPTQIPAVFLAGVGVIFCILATVKVRVPGGKYEMSPRTTLFYGVLALVIGVLWLAVSLQTEVAEYLLVVLLVFFGLVFLAYSRFK